ncbi:hypothetical protein SRHO_G00159170 [Serrasalmus rhombeus]
MQHSFGQGAVSNTSAFLFTPFFVHNVEHCLTNCTFTARAGYEDGWSPSASPPQCQSGSPSQRRSVTVSKLNSLEGFFRLPHAFDDLTRPGVLDKWKIWESAASCW